MKAEKNWGRKIADFLKGRLLSMVAGFAFGTFLFLLAQLFYEWEFFLRLACGFAGIGAIFMSASEGEEFWEGFWTWAKGSR